MIISEIISDVKKVIGKISISRERVIKTSSIEAQAVRITVLNIIKMSEAIKLGEDIRQKTTKKNSD